MSTQIQTVLVVEDEASIASFVSLYLKNAGYLVRTVGTGQEALAQAEAERPDLIVLDLMLPDLDGLEVCRRLRADGRTIPVLILTARADEVDLVVGLDAGADDYVTKPFRLAELLARVRALLRRHPIDVGLSGPVVRIDPDGRRAFFNEEEIQLTAKEFDLLFFLASNPRHVFSRDQLMNRVWGYEAALDTGTVTVHVRRLRSKIERDPAAPRHLETVWGVGYRFVP